MSDNYRKTVDVYSQWCDPNKKPDKSHTVYRPFSMRKVSATKELNRLLERIKELEAEVKDLKTLFLEEGSAINHGEQNDG